MCVALWYGVCCGMVQCDTVWCSALQSLLGTTAANATSFIRCVWQCVAVCVVICCSVLQCVAVSCSVCCSVLWCAAVWYSVL